MRPADASNTGVVDRYFADLREAARLVDGPVVARAFDIIVSCLSAGHAVFVAGNGGSASAASHLTSDWLEASLNTLGSSRVHGLTDNVSVMSRIANDLSYEEIFARQILSLGTEGDVLMLLSVGGRSENLMRAARVARQKGMIILCFLGVPGTLSALSDHSIVVGSADYGLTEDLHIALGHALVRWLRGGEPHVCVDVR